METDRNGLYYMRARYYNTDIRRFINLDTVEGSIQNSQSLNRYAYVEGNPVNLTDPFGLSPMDSGGGMKLVHATLNLLGFLPGPAGMVMDGANAIIYLCEGDYTNALCSTVSVVCGAGGSLLAKFGGRAGKTAASLFQMGTGAFGAVMCVSNGAKGAAAIRQEYRENGGHITMNMACNALSVLGNGAGLFLSGRSVVSGAKGLKSSLGSLGGELGTKIRGGSKSGSKTIQTGARQIDYNAYIKRLETIDMEYESIRMDTTDISKIAHNTGMPEWKISKIKEHVFFNEHILDSGIKRFDSDPEIADAWYRLTNGNYNQNDISLLNHEYFESKFESFYKTDYRTAHNKTEESGRIWDPYKEEN